MPAPASSPAATSPHLIEPAEFARFNQTLIDFYRSTQGCGSLGPVSFERLLLLTTTGRRSGHWHTTPLRWIELSEDFVVRASAGGSPHHPDWLRNVRADASVVIEVGADRLTAVARELTGAERRHALEIWLRLHPDTADDERLAGRRIPLVALRPPGDGY